MTNQKHTVATDALETLGTCPIPDNSGRDAIHLAVEPAIAGCALRPGQGVKIKQGKAVPSVSMGGEDATGIVDPFLTDYVQAGTKFWFVVLPRTITSLRHVWSHPAFPEEPASAYHADADEHYVVPEAERKKAMSTVWVKDYIANNLEGKVDFDYLMNGARQHAESRDDYGAYLYGQHDSGDLEGESLPDEFWVHYENITGKLVPEEKKHSFFTCAC